MLKWLNRYRINKEGSHVVYVDLYEDTVTGVQYISMGDTLCPRYNADGTLYKN